MSQGLWSALLGASTATNARALVVPAGSDNARHRLARVLARLDGSRELVTTIAEGRVPPLIPRAVECRMTCADQDDLARLRDGLDRIARRR
ncbi:MAG: hypothetical protein J2P48_01545 [Alphaproteobacteria bacterium]|nr:hypothetical protein [Alphaproteobacteria bacterium]